MKVQVLLEPSEEGGYTVVVPALPGCISEGDTKDEAIENIKEAIELYMEPVEDDTSTMPRAEILRFLRKANFGHIQAFSNTEIAFISVT